MNNFSDVVRIGKKDAAVRYTQGGKMVTGFSVAVDSGYGDNKQTLWLDCSAWGDRFEKVAPYLLSGTQVFVQGELGTREHEGKTYITLRVAELKLCGGKKEEKRAPGKKAEAQPALEDDEIPF